MMDVAECLVLADTFAEADAYIAGRRDRATVFHAETPASRREGHYPTEVVLLSLDITMQNTAAKVAARADASLTFAGSANSLRP